MKIKIIIVSFATLAILLTATVVFAAKGGDPFQLVWDAIKSLQSAAASLQSQIDNIQLIPGPQGIQGEQGPQGIPGESATMLPEEFRFFFQYFKICRVGDGIDFDWELKNSFGSAPRYGVFWATLTVLPPGEAEQTKNAHGAEGISHIDFDFSGLPTSGEIPFVVSGGIFWEGYLLKFPASGILPAVDDCNYLL